MTYQDDEKGKLPPLKIESKVKSYEYAEAIRSNLELPNIPNSSRYKRFSEHNNSLDKVSEATQDTHLPPITLNSKRSLYRPAPGSRRAALRAREKETKHSR